MRWSRSVVSVALCAILATVAGQTRADHSEYHKVVGGVVIDFGVASRHVIEDQANTHLGRMHGGVPAGRKYHHFMVALFDEQTGNRITDAEVTAKVREVGLAWQRKKLEPMEIAGAMTYGNYFYLPSNATYRMQLEIRRPGVARVIKTQLEYVHIHNGM